jgi:DNA-binding transcriptional LysR family regulator
VKRNLDLQVLEVFVHVCRTGNMTEAGRILGMTQSAVSHVIRQMEDDLGVRLVDRAMRPLALTTTGNLLRMHAERLLADADRMLAEVRGSGQGILPAIGIGFVNSFATTVGPQLVREIQQFASQVSVLAGHSPMLREVLLKRYVDLVISSDEFDDLEGFERHRILCEPFVLLLSKSAAKKYKDVSLQELAEELPFIRSSTRSASGAQIARHLRRIRMEIPSSLEFDTSDAIIAMVAANVGWAITTPLCLLQGQARKTSVVALPLPGPGLSRSLTVVARRGELSDLPSRVAGLACDLLSQHRDHDIKALAPFLADAITIGE